jgi:predicted nucleic acid-binding protein
MNEVLADANVLVRFLINEPPDLAEQAAELLVTAGEERVDVVVPPIIVAEIVYALHSVYKLPRDEVSSRLLGLIDADILVVWERDLIIRSLLWWRDISGVGFADAYLAAIADARRDAAVMSFDREMTRIPGIRLVQEPEQLKR